MIKILKNKLKKHLGFSMVEFLLAITIIGVIAAITMPNLLIKRQQVNTENKVQKFYSTINQALRLSSADNGDIGGWFEQDRRYSYEELEVWLKQYLLPYIKYNKYEECNVPNGKDKGACISLVDGTKFFIWIDIFGSDIIYFVDGDINNTNPRNRFQFQFGKQSGLDDGVVKSQAFIEPYTFAWNGKREHLFGGNFYACKTGCKSCGYCTKILHLNNWKFPTDYPW